MTWFRVDDGFSTHPKILRIPRQQRTAVIGVWLTAGCWSARHLTDGSLPFQVVSEISGGKSAANLLVSVGLWEIADDGWAFRDWGDYQPSRVDVIGERKAHAARQQAYRDRMRAERDAKRDASRPRIVTVNVTEECASRDGGVTAARPDPTRPDPTVVPTELQEEPKTKDSPSATPRTPPGFDEFWEVYPKKTGKQAAIRRFREARKTASIEAIVGGARRYRDDPAREVQYTKHPEGWLTAGRWTDDPDSSRSDPAWNRPPTSRPRPSTTDQAVADALARSARAAAQENAQAVAELAAPTRMEIVR